MSKYIKRILVDYIDLNNEPLENIHIYYDDNNITTLYTLIIGPKDTPYEGGYYYFKIEYDETYPNKAPKCKFETINNKIRFNPNLYENGKICLSILGTWSGPGWKPVMNTRSILLNFQSLLHEYPIINEPMYNNLNVNDIKSLNYNKILKYYNYKFAILEMFKKKDYYPFFNDIIEKHFNENYEKYINELEELSKTLEGIHIKVYPWNNSSATLEYKKLLQKYKNLKG